MALPEYHEHPDVIEAAEWEGQLYIAMEYVEGKTLYQRLKEGPLPLKELVHTMSETATTTSDPADGTYSLTGLPLEQELVVCASMEDPDVDGYIGECYNNVDEVGWGAGFWLTLVNSVVDGVDILLNDHSMPYYMEQFTFNTRSGRILEDVDIRKAIAYGTNRYVLLWDAWQP